MLAGWPRQQQALPRCHDRGAQPARHNSLQPPGHWAAQPSGAELRPQGRPPDNVPTKESDTSPPTTNSTAADGPCAPPAAQGSSRPTSGRVSTRRKLRRSPM